jgi:hypothetical protein
VRNSQLDFEQNILEIARLLHIRMAELSEDARRAGNDVLAADIHNVKLELANRITLAVLGAQLVRIREREIGNG